MNPEQGREKRRIRRQRGLSGLRLCVELQVL